MTKKQKQVLSKIHEEVITKYYGCGSPIPPLEKGLTVLDLGSGTGRDSFIASAFVGESGKVIGVDMTDEQLAIANKYREYHAKAYSLEKINVEFKKGLIEDLRSIGIADNSVDVVISNCVINLSPDKPKVLSEIFRVLKPGGELYYSDVFSDRRIPEHLQKDKVLWGECLSGALYLEDFRRMMHKIGFNDYRVVENTKVAVNNPDIEKKVGSINFTSKTIRAFKLESLEDRCEDFGQTATYRGNLEDFPHAFVLDKDHIFITDMPKRVCGNTADMLSKTRYGKYFHVSPRGPHIGLFGATEGSGSGCVGCC